MKIIKYILGFAILIIFSGYAVFHLASNEPANYVDTEATVVFENGEEVAVEIADNPAERMQGLSGKEGLSRGNGMWFVFDEPQNLAFWMRDMNFAIDIVWISGDKVVGVKHSAQPESFPERFYPPVPANRVLEIPAGDAERLGITTGQTVRLK